MTKSTRFPDWVSEAMTRAPKFSRKVPDWVREEYSSIRQICLGGDFDDDAWLEESDANRYHRLLPRATKIVSTDPKSDDIPESVWKTLHSRESHFVGDSSIRRKAWWSSAKTLGNIAEAVLDAEDSFAGVHSTGNADDKQKFTTAQVNARSTEIAKAIQSLSTMLKRTDYANPHFRAFARVRESLKDVANEHLETSWRERVLSNDLPVGFDLLELENFAGDLSDHFTEFLDQVARLIVGRPDERFMLGKPNEKTAQRTFLLVHLNNVFKRSYGLPLHEVNLAITSVFHPDECKNLTAAKVATTIRAATKNRKQS